MRWARSDNNSCRDIFVFTATALPTKKFMLWVLPRASTEAFNTDSKRTQLADLPSWVPDWSQVIISRFLPRRATLFFFLEWLFPCNSICGFWKMRRTATKREMNDHILGLLLHTGRVK